MSCFSDCYRANRLMIPCLKCVLYCISRQYCDIQSKRIHRAWGWVTATSKLNISYQCVFFRPQSFSLVQWRLIYFLKLGSLEVDDEHNYSGRKVPSLNCCWVLLLLLLLLFVVHVQVFDFFNFSHALFNGGFDCRPSYSGQKAPSLKIERSSLSRIVSYFSF